MSPKILSVDDSKAVRMLLARLFCPFDCELFEAANGEEGLAVAVRERPDLIILDYNMPVMDGVSMLRQLRESADLRRTPVIMLTAESSAENIATVARLGVRDYVTKPFSEVLFLAKVARTISLVARPTHGRRERKPASQPQCGGDAEGPGTPGGPKSATELAESSSAPSAAPLQRASVLVVDDSRPCGSASFGR